MLGADPELFASYVQDGKDFVYSPAALEKFEGVKRIGGTEKHPVFIETENTRWIMDGVAFELNFKKPFTDLKEFFSTLVSATDQLQEFVGRYGYSVSKKPVINFDYKRFWTKELSKDESFMQGIIFGCDPDKDAFDVDWLAKVLNVTRHPRRYGGGHIHISGDESIEEFPIPFVKLLALTVGNYCISQSPFEKEEVLRAKYYGKPGKFRIQNYETGVGVEYRTPSNSWLNYTYEQFEGIFSHVEKALDYLKNPSVGQEMLEVYVEPTIQAITTADKELANIILGGLK
jgi:hypothetical protein